MDVTIRFRDTPANKARYEAAARATKQSLSDWVRESLDASAECDLNEPGHAAPEPRVLSEVVGKVLPKDPKEVAEAVRTIKPPAKRGTVEPKKLSEAIKDTRTQQERMDDFYRSNMAKGKK